jgi:hypothetical protein
MALGSPSPFMPPRPQHVPPQMVPTDAEVGKATVPGGELVALMLHSANGSFTFFFDPERAESVAAGLLEVARQARTGLVIAKGSIPAP